LVHWRRGRFFFDDALTPLAVVERSHAVLELGLHGDDGQGRRRNVLNDPMLGRKRVGHELGDLIGLHPLLHPRPPDQRVRGQLTAREGGT
jgi:hypothetical protein